MTDTPVVGRNGIPVPDPSVLTTDIVNAAKEDLRREDRVIHDSLTLSLNALRTELLGEIRRLSDIDGERLLRIDQRFEERDERTDQIAQLGRISLDAALAAAKEAVGEQNKSNALSITKSESSMKEQVSANAVQAGTRIDALSDKFDDLKSRMDRGEGGTSGQRYERTEHRSVQTLSTNIMVGVGLVIIGALALIAPHIH
jgi:hypothetical protein